SRVMMCRAGTKRGAERVSTMIKMRMPAMCARPTTTVLATLLTTTTLLASALLVPAAGFGQPSPALIEARRHMLDPEINAFTFRSMEALFDTYDVPAEGQP